MKSKVITYMLIGSCILSITGCKQSEDTAEAGTVVISEEAASDDASTETTEEETQSLRRKNELAVVSDDPDVEPSSFFMSMNNTEYNFFDDETYEYSWLGKDSAADYSSIPQTSIALIAKEVVDDNGYNSVSAPTYIGSDYDNEMYYLVFDDTYYLEVVYNAKEQGAYAILGGADLPEGVEKVTTKYTDEETYLARREIEAAAAEERRNAEKEEIAKKRDAEQAAIAATGGVTIEDMGSPDIVGPTYGFEFPDFGPLIEAGLNLPATYQLKVELSNFLTNNGYDPYQAGDVAYVDGTFSEADGKQSFVVSISGYPDLRVRGVYTIESRELEYEAIEGITAAAAGNTEG